MVILISGDKVALTLLLYYTITVDEIFKYIFIDPQRPVTLAHQVKQQINWLIASGTIKPGDRLPSIRRLAAHLGINLHTVRNAYAMLESEGQVETRQGWGTEVLEIDMRRVAQASISVRSHTIGVIVPSLANPFYHQVLQGIQEVADRQQAMIFVCNSMDEPLEAWRLFNQLLSKGVDGIIVASQPFEQFFPDEGKSTGQELTGVPYVSIDWPESPSYSVVMDLESASYQGTQHLVEHGHRRIGLVTFSFFDPEDRPEYLGYKRALEGAGLKVDQDLIAYMLGFGVDAGREAAAQLLKCPNPPTAIFAFTDLMAVGAMQTIKAAGLQVPQDIALVGFNDIPLASLVDPPLTTVSAPGHKLGTEGMRLLNSMMAGKRPKQRRTILPTPLVIRRSCGCTGE